MSQLSADSPWLTFTAPSSTGFQSLTSKDLFEARRLMTEQRSADMDALLQDSTTPAHTRII